MASNKDYFGLSWIVSLVLAIIPVTSWVCGAVTRFQEKKYLACLIRVFLGCTLIWVLDLVCMILGHKICRIL